MELVRIKYFNKYYKRIKKLNKLSFPKEEYMSCFSMLYLQKKGILDFYAVMDENEFVGFINLIVHEDICFLLYLCIDENKRNKGYGSKILSLIYNKYPFYLHILNIEPIDEKASNNDIRIKRKAFYLKNGYQESTYFLDCGNMQYEMLFKGQSFDMDKIKKVLSKFEGSSQPNAKFYQK